jgi:hypothetical protein
VSASRADASEPAKVGHYMPYKEKSHDQSSQCTGNDWSRLRIRAGDLSQYLPGNRYVWKQLREEQSALLVKFSS